VGEEDKVLLLDFVPGLQRLSLAFLTIYRLVRQNSLMQISAIHCQILAAEPMIVEAKYFTF
jgi:hypothetical protein